eukprot:g2288.t1
MMPVPLFTVLMPLALVTSPAGLVPHLQKRGAAAEIGIYRGSRCVSASFPAPPTAIRKDSDFDCELDLFSPDLASYVESETGFAAVGLLENYHDDPRAAGGPGTACSGCGCEDLGDFYFCALEVGFYLDFCLEDYDYDFGVVGSVLVPLLRPRVYSPTLPIDAPALIIFGHGSVWSSGDGCTFSHTASGLPWPLLPCPLLRLRSRGGSGTRRGGGRFSSLAS